MGKIWIFFFFKLIQDHLRIWSNRFLFSASFPTSDPVWTFSPLHSSPFISARFWIHIPPVFFSLWCCFSLACFCVPFIMTFLHFHTLPSSPFSSSSSFFAVFCLPSLPPQHLYLCLLFPDLLLAFTLPASPPVCLYCLISELKTESGTSLPIPSLFLRSILCFLRQYIFFPLQFSPSTLIFCVIWKVICSSL